jgi:pyruvate formate lyase activating enzyme
MGTGIGVCPQCIRDRWGESVSIIEENHLASRRAFHLPSKPPRNPHGLDCKICFHECRIGPDEKGYCGVRTGSPTSFRQDGRLRAKVSCYYDPLPTNCVADWVCPGGTGAGFPVYAHDRTTEVGFYNLAVFFEACNFNCLFCQNWSFKWTQGAPVRWHSVDSLAEAVNDRTSCICYFGGDPVPQVPYALKVSEQARRAHSGKILRICWETNGSMHPAWLKRMARISLESGGCIKVDLKAWDPRIHKALCGFDNRAVLENFASLAGWAELRPDPPFLVASTLLVPGYVEEAEVSQLASFIARLNPDIPYTLLAFAPQFCLDDFPTTSRSQAEACLEAARKAGLRKVRLGNRHLVS